MDLHRLAQSVTEVRPYDEGTHAMWTDPYISQRLLDIHLDPKIGAASRIPQSIDATVAMIHDQIRSTSRILDLGCGPGLYAKRLAQRGHQVTGIDFAPCAIEYAQAQPDTRRYRIKYVCDDYLASDFCDGFDAVLMIFCDFGALVPKARSILMKKIHKALKPGGVFIFDAMTERSIARMNFGRSWEMVPGGFFSPNPYICLHEARHFPGYQATLDQHVLILENYETKIYRFWNHYFDRKQVRALFLEAGFSDAKALGAILSGEGPPNDDSVMFYGVEK